MSALISQATSDAPTILLLAEKSSLADTIKQLFIDNGFEVSLVSAANYSQKQLKSLENQEFYKIVLVYGFANSDLKVFNDFFDFFITRSESKIIIAPWPRNLELLASEQNELTQEYVQISQQQRQIYDQLQSVVGLKIFVLDLVLEETLLYPLAFCLQLFKQQVVLDPETNFALLDLKSLVQTLRSLLLKPFVLETYYFQGKTQPSSQIVEVLKDLVFKFYQKELAIRKLRLKNTVLDPIGSPKTVIYEDLKVIIEKPLRNIADYLKKIKIKKEALDLIKEKQVVLNKARKEKRLINSDNLSNNDPDIKNNSRQEKFKEKNPLPVVTQKSKPKIQPPKQNIEQTIDQELSTLFGANRKENTSQRQIKKIKEIKTVKKKTKKKKILFLLGLFFSIIGSGIAIAFLVFFISFSLVKKQFVNSATAYVNNDLNKEWQVNQKFYFKFLNTQVNFYQGFFTLAAFDEANQIIKISEQIADWQTKKVSKEEILKDVYWQIFSPQSENLDSEKITILTTLTQQLFEAIAQTQAQVKQLKKSSFSAFKDFNLEDFNQTLLGLQKQNAAKLSFEQQLKKILAIEGKKTYAVILQDNQELRPSGGFIQAVAVMDFKDGQLIDHQVYGVYQLDAMVPGTVELPEEIKPYLAEENWFFHDANWAVDFPSSANQIAWFLKQATNHQIDGVVTLNYESLATLLAYTGKLDLNGFNQVLDNKNFFNRVENQIENTVNQENTYYAQEILEQFIGKLVNLSQDESLEILDFYFNQLENNQEFMVFFDQDLQQTIKELTWDGNLVIPQCPSSFMIDDCLIDSLYVNETNIGLNKVNKYIQRQANHQVTFKENQILHHYQLDLSNTAYTNNFPLGIYRTYLRIYLPPDTQVSEVKVNKEIFGADRVYQTQVKGFKILGLVLEIAPSQSSKLELFYSQENPYQNNFAYVFLNQKQAGLSPTPVATSISFSADFKPVIVAPQAEIFNSNIVFNTQSVKHDFFAIKFE